MRTRPHGMAIFVLALGFLAASTVRAEESLAVLPGAVSLHGLESRQRLLVVRSDGANYRGPAEGELQFTVENPAIVKIEDGEARPIANGTTKITATIGGRSATVEAIVTGCDQPFVWSFRNHVEPVLTKASCNMGACHGAAAGKKGFRLSLRGYDPEGDYANLTRQARGRRIVPSDPGRSLLLTKPTTAVPHGGGPRLEVGSLEYRVIAEWIAAGTPPPLPEDPRLIRLEILPGVSVLAPGMTQQLVVRAHFSDGHVEDVTRWAKYVSTNESVALVEPDGKVRVMGHGEGAVTALYLSQVVVGTITVPFAQAVPPETFAAVPRRNFIDEHVLAKLQSLNIPPSPACSDAEFLRRAHLDTIGVLPTAEETRAFLADGSPDKHDRLIERLLSREEFVDYWAYKWSDLLLVNSEKLPPPAMWAYYNWVRDQIAAGTPWDELVRRLLTASGSTLENGAGNFFVLHQDPAELAETTAQAFMGMSIGCAKCHNHPLEKWTNDQYYGMANLFARVRSKDLSSAGNRLIFATTEGELVQPLTGRPQPPRPLDAAAIPFEATADRRATLAAWLTAPENSYFSRSIANRVWANFFAVGLVENVDDLRATNPASNEPLLAAAAQHLVASGYDLKSLMRTILQSNIYHRSSQPLPENLGDDRYFSRYYPRRLMAEVLLDGLSAATAAPTDFPGYPPGWRAIQLPDANVASYFLKTFGRPDRVITCECERTEQPSMVQVLHISNGDTINQKLQRAGNRLEKLMNAGAPDYRIIEEAYLAALSRYPTDHEMRGLLAEFATAPPAERRAVAEDLFWGILSSREFLFNH